MVFVLAIQASCGPGPLSLAEAGQGEALDYGDELSAWTRHGRIYTDFETNVIVHATYLAPRFLAAYEQEYRKMYDPTEREMADVRERLFDRRKSSECFFVAVFTGQRDWNDFSLANSIWRVHLENDSGVRVRSGSVGQVESGDLVYEHFFPYFERFYEGYAVCFPNQALGGTGVPMLGEGTRSFVLDMTSPLGKISLTWELGS